MTTISARAKSPTRAEAIAKALKPGPVFNNGVLLGNWVEDRIECPKAGTFYFPPKEVIDYEKLQPEVRQLDFRQNKLSGLQKLNLKLYVYCLPCYLSPGCNSNPKRPFILRQDDDRLSKVHISMKDLQELQGNVPTVIRHDSHDSCGNFATTTDLVYNHLPKPLCGPDLRHYKKSAHQFYPQPDLMKCFGNVTEWGLKKYLQHEWDCTGVSDYSSTLYDDSYVPPQPHQYLQRCERKARNSSFTKSFRFKMTKSKQ